LISLAENFLNFKSEIPGHVKIVAVSKTKPVEDIIALYNTGSRIFGENKVQEMVDKAMALPKDIEWHAIGHLQTNKVKYIAPFVSLIHSVDSFKIMKVIDNEAIKNNRNIDCLLQIHIAEEETKFGFSDNELISMLNGNDWKNLKNISLNGVMGMASYTDDKEKIRNEFRKLYSIYKKLKADYFSHMENFKEISMGMSGDYKIAIEEGATMIRIGSTIFGERNYSKTK
jgi:pyridoxal phosphate enzyme (YggS family)